MPRPSALVLCLILSAPARAQAPVQTTASAACADEAKDVAWDAPCYKEYFAYQRHLSAQGLEGETPERWGALTKEERVEKAKRGMEYLRGRLAELLQDPHLSPADNALIEAVWGKELAAKAQTLAKARELKDPEQIRRALEGVKGLHAKVGAATRVDWGSLFDGAGLRGGVADPRLDSGKDYLAVSRPQGFLASLQTPEVKAALATRRSFSEFLAAHDVPRDALPTFQAMYDVLQRAPAEEKAELSHILPTVARFVADGKSVALADLRGALGVAVPGDYDRPEAVRLSRDIAKADPVVAGKTLAHEFQHIYDMYAGRYYTLDSEMRGFKVAVVYFRAVQKAAPQKWKELLNGDDEARAVARDAADYSAAYDRGPQAFADAVAFGHGYTEWSEGVFMGRAPLRDAIDPGFGAARELAGIRRLRDEARARLDALEKRQEELRRRRDRGAASRELDVELEKAAKDLQAARYHFGRLDGEYTLKDIRVRRMQQEAAWLDQRSKGAKEPYDLRLQVDADYVTP